MWTTWTHNKHTRLHRSRISASWSEHNHKSVSSGKRFERFLRGWWFWGGGFPVNPVNKGNVNLLCEQAIHSYAKVQKNTCYAALAFGTKAAWKGKDTECAARRKMSNKMGQNGVSPTCRQAEQSGAECHTSPSHPPGGFTASFVADWWLWYITFPLVEPKVLSHVLCPGTSRDFLGQLRPKCEPPSPPVIFECTFVSYLPHWGFKPLCKGVGAY